MLYKEPANVLMAPLQTTNGVVFPFQPSVQLGYNAQYTATELTHSNFAFFSYKNSSFQPITLSCEFPCRSPFEGRYVIAAMTFLRACTFMFTGQDDTLAGSPPPVLRLTGMGFGGLDTIPCVLTNVTTEYPDNVDYVTVGITTSSGGVIEYVKVPTSTRITTTLQPIFSRDFATTFSTKLFGLGAERLIGPLTDTVVSAADSTSPEQPQTVSFTPDVEIPFGPGPTIPLQGTPFNGS
jgi:hypothetical protein